jgi:hypothetical protein
MHIRVVSRLVHVSQSRLDGHVQRNKSVVLLLLAACKKKCTYYYDLENL